MSTDPLVVAYVATTLGLLGLAIGSFLNVVVYRVPAGKSVIFPASSCPKCGEEIKKRHNVPVFGWLILKGKCFNCSQPISPRYPLVELITGILFTVVVLWNGVNWLLLPLLYLLAISISLTLIDLDVHRLPNKIVGLSYIVILLAFIPQAFVAHQWDNYLRGLCGLTVFFIIYFVLSLYPNGMGLGDVKLAGVLGFVLGWFGWSFLLIGFFLPFFIGGLISLILILFKMKSFRGGIPFGPSMFAGTWLAVIYGQQLWDQYLNLIG